MTRLPYRPPPPTPISPIWARRQWMLLIFIIITAILLWRALYLQVMHTDFLQTQGEARHLRTLPIVAHRGMLLDRNAVPLAVSTPVDSVWLNPAQFEEEKARWQQLATILNISVADIATTLKGRMQREFVYLKRRISPNVAQQVEKLGLDGVFLQREYGRYYPTGELCAHLVGFTNIDDVGQEGIERSFNNLLAGEAGAKQVVQGRHGQIIADVRGIKMAHPGVDIRLSIDNRLQYVALRELKAAILEHQAKSGSLVILDINSGEVLAMVNYPTYNPNNVEEREAERIRNRAVTDVFEPGSTMKPFTLSAALESRQYQATSTIDTNPGYLMLDKYKVKDSHNYGTIDLTTVLQKSSNIGAAKIGLSLSSQNLWQMFSQLGFGKLSGSGFSGEVSGFLPPFQTWNRVKHASVSFGYGLNVNALQLARAYAVLGNNGILPPIRLLQLSQSELATASSFQVMRRDTAKAIVRMLETVTVDGGTGEAAAIKGFRVAGKTGTVRKVTATGYSESQYFALFAGLVPASRPRFAMVVMIDTPQEGEYYGGKVAAPVFAKVMSQILQWLNIPPDAE
jgi:cell division protein FtsI (penicillin-binding protein 3)